MDGEVIASLLLYVKDRIKMELISFLLSGHHVNPHATWWAVMRRTWAVLYTNQSLHMLDRNIILFSSSSPGAKLKINRSVRLSWDKVNWIHPPDFADHYVLVTTMNWVTPAGKKCIAWALLFTSFYFGSFKTACWKDEVRIDKKDRLKRQS